MMFSVVTISMEIVFKTTCKLNNLGLTQSQELWSSTNYTEVKHKVTEAATKSVYEKRYS